jgi:hypothetical protein
VLVRPGAGPGTRHRISLVGAVALIALLDLAQVAPTIVEDLDPLPDAGEGLLGFLLERLEDLGCVVVGAGADPGRDVLGLLDDPAALGLGGLREASLADEERGLFLGPADDARRLVVGLLDDPLTLGVDPLRRADLLGDGDAELVDEIEDRVLVDEDAPGDGQTRAGRDLGLEPLEEEDDVQRRPRA